MTDVDPRQKYCPVCAAERLRESSRRSKRKCYAEQRLREPRYCVLCGIEITNRTGNRKYCEECAENAKGKKSYTRRSKKRSDGTAEMDALCRQAQEKHFPLPTVRPTSYWKHKDRKCKLTGDEIAFLAKYFDRPYDSYGKLRAYIDTYDALPPDRFLRGTPPATHPGRITSGAFHFRTNRKGKRDLSAYKAFETVGCFCND